MKFLTIAGLLACVAGLSGCATPAGDTGSDSLLAANAATYEDKGDLITGSRIPQKSTTHVLKRVGNADYKKAKQDASSGNVGDTAAPWGK
ncbi:MAG: hypothetical protein H7335_18435 [Massilia sp.]|nr:hypothetical protein [Massilia sp.]